MFFYWVDSGGPEVVQLHKSCVCWLWVFQGVIIEGW